MILNKKLLNKNYCQLRTEQNPKQNAYRGQQRLKFIAGRFPKRKSLQSFIFMS